MPAPLFADVRRVNELFGFGKGRPIAKNTEVKQVISWANVILRQYSLRLVRRGEQVRLTREHGILELIRRRSTLGVRYEDAGGLLN